MTKEKLQKMRGEVIEKFINIETMMNAIICHQYIGKVTQPFLLQVLYDEYFSFGLRRRILEKIIKNPEKGLFEKLNRLNTIRNYFAHLDLQMFETKSIPEPEKRGITPDPKNLDKAVDFEKLYGEFLSLAPNVEEQLGRILMERGLIEKKQ
ncbi:MAG: hypothetical protein WCX64_03855 [Candidatus Micrarchaeia archaeon]